MMMVWPVELVSAVALLLAILAPLRLVQAQVLVVLDGQRRVRVTPVPHRPTVRPITLPLSPLGVSVVVSVHLLWQAAIQVLRLSQLSLRSGTRWHPFGAVDFVTARLHSTVVVAAVVVAAI